MSNQLPQGLLNVIKQKKEESAKRIKQARERIPKEYHDFLVLLDQNVNISSKIYNTDNSPDAFSTERGTYVKIQLPYMTVDGRVQLARDDHRKEGKKFNIHPVRISDDGSFCEVFIESEMLGTASGVAKINVGGSGVDRTNPLENAQSSAIGRACGFLGYGLVGTGIATLEEVEEAMKNGSEIQGSTPFSDAPGSDEDKSSTFQSSSTSQSSNSPQPFRIKATCAPTDNQDGTCLFKAYLENMQIVSVQVPKELSASAKLLVKPDAILQVKGWHNEGKMTLKLAKRNAIELEQKNMAS